VIDTHCHLTFPDFAGKLEATLAEAAASCVSGCITISTTTHDCLDALKLAKAHERVWCTAGIHPSYSAKGPHEWHHVRTVALDEKCVAWGELGLDNHHGDPPRDIQHEVLNEQLAFIQSCREGQGGHKRIEKPIVLHCREAFDDLIPVLRATKLDPTRFVFHCFTGTPADMRKVLDFGAMVSFTGVVTYKNASELREAVKLVPEDRFMVETDAPYLSPEPRRGERPCRPAFTRLTAEGLAVLRNTPFNQLHEQVNQNTRGFFGIDAF
jgi:TatD DNase family protein